MIEYAKSLDSPEGIYGVLLNADRLKVFADAAADETHPANIMAQNILNVLSEKTIKISVLKPIFNANNRLLSQNTQENPQIEESNLNKIKVYPNPASKVFMVNNNTKTELSITVYNSSGQLIHKTKSMADNETKINCFLWPSGIYFVTLTNQDGELKTEKLIIE
jgi:hypothetical protein